MGFSFRDAERRLWLEGQDAFRDLLHREAVMVLPMPHPILKGKSIEASLEGIPRWDEVTFRSVNETDAGSTHVFAYEASGVRGEQHYECACLSVWVEGSDGWRLISHSQTRPAKD